MTNTKKNIIFLSLIALLLAVVSAALLFVIAPHRPANAEEPATIPVLSEAEALEKLSEPQEGQMLKEKYLLIAYDVERVDFMFGVLNKGDGVYEFSWYVDGTAGEKNIEYTTVIYNDAEYSYLLFDDNAGYEAFTYQTQNNEDKIIYVSSTALLFERYGQETNTDEKKPFDLGEWLANAGDDVSAWLGDNVGIATTGSTVLIVGAVIIVVILARRRRR